MPHSATRPAAEPLGRTSPAAGPPARRGSGLLSQRLVALSIAFALLVNFPLLALFVLWGVFIAALAWLLERHAESA